MRKGIVEVLRPDSTSRTPLFSRNEFWFFIIICITRKRFARRISFCRSRRGKSLERQKNPLSGEPSVFMPVLQKSLHFLCIFYKGKNFKKNFTNIYIASATEFSGLFPHMLSTGCKVCITGDKKTKLQNIRNIKKICADDVQNQQKNAREPSSSVLCGKGRKHSFYLDFSGKKYYTVHNIRTKMFCAFRAIRQSA